MATATATQTKPNGATMHEVEEPEMMVVEAQIASGIFKGKMVDLTIDSDGSAVHMSDPKITPEEREAWDWLMQITKNAVESAKALQKQTERSRLITDEILNRSREATQ